MLFKGIPFIVGEDQNCTTLSVCDIIFSITILFNANQEGIPMALSFFRALDPTSENSVTSQ